MNKELYIVLMALLLMPYKVYSNNAAVENSTKEWYSVSVFEGAILQAPFIINSQEVIVFTDNSAIQRYDFRTGTRWSYSFKRIPHSQWHIQNGDSILINTDSALFSFSHRGYLGRSNFAVSPIQGESYTLIDGKFVSITNNSTVQLFPGMFPSVDSPYITWESSQGDVQGVYTTPSGRIIMHSAESIYWYNSEGKLLNARELSKNMAELRLINNEVIVQEQGSNRYSIYSIDGDLKYSGHSAHAGELVLSIGIRSLSGQGSERVHIYEDNGRLFISCPNNGSFELYRIEEPWEIQHYSYKNGYLFMSDSLWRLHRFDLNTIIDLAFNSRIEASEGGAEYQAPAPNLLTTLLIDLVEKPDLFQSELETLIENFQQNPSSLEDISRALMQIAHYVYRSQNNYRIRDPRLRSALLHFLFLHSGTQTSLEILNILQEETNPLVYKSLIPLMAQKTAIVQIEALRNIIVYLQLNALWQEDREFINNCIDFFINVHRNIASEEFQLEKLLEQGFNILYTNIYEQDIRQKIFQYTS